MKKRTDIPSISKMIKKLFFLVYIIYGLIKLSHAMKDVKNKDELIRLTENYQKRIKKFTELR